jgi:hypothetical protein
MTTVSTVVRAWWPLAASWALMALELPAVSAFIARLPDPEVHLAAYGGIVFPLAILIEAPIIMLLAASTALCQDASSYRRVRGFMLVAGLGLSLVHVVVVFSPLYSLIVRGIIGAPEEIVEPARWGLMAMPLWTFCIAYRRFQQGILIRFGHSRAVGVGTLLRLFATLAVLVIGYNLVAPGALTGALAVQAGVLVEAIYAGLRVRSVVREHLQDTGEEKHSLDWKVFFSFYVPLALTPLFTILAQPIGSTALSNMPEDLESLAIWPPLYGMVFLLRCLGMGFNEIVVSHLGRPGAREALARFAGILAFSTAFILLLMSVTPLADLYFSTVTALAPDLASRAAAALWLTIPLPAFAALQSFFGGALVHARRTRGITEAVAIQLTLLCIVLGIGVQTGRHPGLLVALTAYVVGNLGNTTWLYLRSRGILKNMRALETRTRPAQEGSET